MPPHVSESPAKKQSKWSQEEDALIIELRGSGMKWEDISKRLPGRSAISCRLHYQNYLERRSEWDEERKNKLARLYERFKPEMWSKVAEEMQLPWRAAEAMHWQLGEADMARRAGVVPFSLSAVSIDAPPQSQSTRHSPRHSHSHSVGSVRYQRPPQPNLLPMASGSSMSGGGAGSGNRALAARRDSSTPRTMNMLTPPGMLSPGEGLILAGIPNLNGHAEIGRGGLLPSVAEMTTGVSMAGYSAPAYAVTTGIGGGGYPGPDLGPREEMGYELGRGTALGYERTGWQSEGKRRASPDVGPPRDSTRRRH